jgi:hypothetical protein
MKPMLDANSTRIPIMAANRAVETADAAARKDRSCNSFHFSSPFRIASFYHHSGT